MTKNAIFQKIVYQLLLFYNWEGINKMKFSLIEQVANHQTNSNEPFEKHPLPMKKHLRFIFSVIIKCSRSLQMGMKKL